MAAPAAWAVAPPRPEQVAPGVLIDWDAGTVEAGGRAAADLRAPTAEVARIKAERTAKERAREQIKKALLDLPKSRWPDRPAAALLDPALAGAETVKLDYGSSGSVYLRLRLSLSALPTAPLPPAGARNRLKEKSKGKREEAGDRNPAGDKAKDRAGEKAP
jgi:hypothetical protein